MIILDVTVLAPGTQVGKKLGNPQTWSEETAAAPAQPVRQPVPTPSPAKPQMPMAHSAPAGLDNSILAGQMTHPIASLSPYQNK